MTNCRITVIVTLALLLIFSAAVQGKMPDKAKKRFKAFINSVEASERAEAVGLLAQETDQKKALKMLLILLNKEEDETVINAIFNVMKGMTDPKAIKGITRAAKKCRNGEQRAEYIKVLFEIDNPKTFELLLQFIKDPTWQVRQTLAELLGETFKKKGVEKSKAAIRLLIRWIAVETDERTQIHVRAALYHLTGCDFGLDNKKWKEWWTDNERVYEGPLKPEDAPKTADGKTPGYATGVKKEIPVDPTKPLPRFFGHELKNSRLTFVIDVSGSMSESSSGGKTKLQIVKDELTKTINSFDKRYWFNMVFYSTGCVAWKKKLEKATDAFKKEAVEKVASLSPLAATNISMALKMASKDGNTDTIILLSDGKPTAGIIDPTAVLRDVRSWNKFRKIKINTVGMQGCDPDFMRKLAAQNGGSYTEAP